MTGLVAALVASLTGSLHCAGMCGGFVALYAGGRGGSGLARHAGYNLGRLVAYVTLGTLAGALAGALDAAADTLMGVQRVVTVALGVLLVALALRELGLFGKKSPGLVGVDEPGGARGPVARLRALTSRLLRRPDAGAAFGVGLLSAVLPCGWLWSFVVLAGTTGGAFEGALVMSAFWLGTVPALMAVGGLAKVLGASLRKRTRHLAAVALLVAGGWAIFGKWQPHLGDHAPQSSTEAPPCHDPE
jgi:uncharacterized protein